ncbi:hypothetical protein [Micromonospora sp. WMMD737]|uniref:hypothetical protein n=1 Tax=Micromonospora sp. WMMD737 TaxID=3404113 RepID=UPI003B95C02E
MTITISLNDRQIGMLDLAADNGGTIHAVPTMSPADRTAIDSLVRCGLLSRPGAHGSTLRDLTDHGHRTHANLVVGRAAANIATHLDGDRRKDRAFAAADDLHQAGYLTGGNRAGHPDLITGTAAILACRHDAPTADRMARQLADAGLLAGQNRTED